MEGKKPTRPPHRYPLKVSSRGQLSMRAETNQERTLGRGQLPKACLNTEGRPEEDVEEVSKSQDHDSYPPTSTKDLASHSSHEIGLLTWSDFY